MRKDILLSLCTRGRPWRAFEFIEQWQKTTNGRSRLVMAMDLDDPTLPEYEQPEGVLRVLGSHRHQGDAINHVLEAYPDYDYYGFMSDDQRLNTPNWEDLIADTLMYGGVAYGDDGFQGQNLPTSAFFNGDTLRAVGYVAPTGMGHMYIDNVWKDLGEGLGMLYYLPEFNVEHLHPDAGKAQKDEGYHKVNNPAVYGRDFEVYNRWLEGDYPAAVKRMRAAHEVR